MEVPFHSFLLPLLPTSLFWVHPSAGDWWFGFCSLWRCLQNYAQAVHDNNIKVTGLMLHWPTSFKVLHCLMDTMANVCYWSKRWVGKSRIMVQWVFIIKRRWERAEKRGEEKYGTRRGPEKSWTCPAVVSEAVIVVAYKQQHIQVILMQTSNRNTVIKETAS